MNYKPYKHLPPFKGMVLQNFPFIEEDFDAITNYQLLCKVVEYLKNVIANELTMEENVTNLYNSFVELKNYVDNYFANLDVQEEINNKLDDMAEDGTLQNIILNYLNIEKTFNTLQDMIEDESLYIGQKVKVYSHSILNDGGGGYFVISDTGNISLSNGLKATPIYNFMNNYYDEITVVKERHFDTDCYFTTIPKYDKYGNLIKLYVGYGDGKTPLEYADNENTDLTINASLYLHSTTHGNGVPSIISNGVIIRENDMLGGLPENILYLGIKADRTFVDYPVISTTAEQMLADGCEQVFDVFWKLVDNGVAVDLSNVVRDDGVNADAVQGPRQTIGVKMNGDVVILTCDGRTEANIGLYSHEQQQLMIQKGCVNAWNLDGGGSTSTVIKGTKINRNIDDNGTVDRYIPYTLNIKKPLVNKEVADVYSQIGKVKQETIQQIVPNLQDYKIGALILVDPFTLNSDTYTPINLGTVYGNNYSKEHIILEKENEEDTNYIKFKINKKGYFKVTCFVGLTSRTGPSAKYIKTRRITNDYDLPGSTINCASTLNSAQRMFLSNQAYIRVRSIDEEYQILLSGDSNDAITQGSIMIEEI